MSIILAIRPRFAGLIYEGLKTVELRLTDSVVLGGASGICAFLYETSPMKAITGYVTLGEPSRFDIDLASANHEYLNNVLDSLCITEADAKGYLKHRPGYIYPVDDPVLFDNPVPREKLQKLGIYMPQSFVRIDAETEALLMCLSKEAAV